MYAAATLTVGSCETVHGPAMFRVTSIELEEATLLHVNGLQHVLVLYVAVWARMIFRRKVVSGFFIPDNGPCLVICLNQLELVSSINSATQAQGEQYDEERSGEAHFWQLASRHVSSRLP